MDGAFADFAITKSLLNMHSPRSDRPAGGNLGQSPWIVSAAFDLPLIANLGWLLFCIPGFIPVQGPSHVEFWQIYFLTLPHRWLTLLLVASDPDRRGSRSVWFVVIALITCVVVVGMRWATGAFTCLALVDYVWNYWHFAAQHGGVLRMYSRKAGGGRPRLETWGLRLPIFYVALRLAGWSTGWTESYASAASVINALDFSMLGIFGLLWAVELLATLRRLASPGDSPVVSAGPAGERLPAVSDHAQQMADSGPRRGKLIYLASVSGLYTLLMIGLRTENRPLVLSLALAVAVFHATEYLAIVTHYAWRRQSQGTAGAFQRIARNWVTALAVYIVCWGLCAYLVDHGSQSLREFWLGLNLWASALHYAFDGMIWKLRAPQTAKVLGVELPATQRLATPARTAGVA